MVGSRLKELRKKAGLTQEDVGKAMGVSKQAVSSWETNTNEPGSDIVKALSELYGVSSDYLIGADGAASMRRSERALSDNELQIVTYYRQCHDEPFMLKLMHAVSAMEEADRYMLLSQALRMASGNGSQPVAAGTLPLTGTDSLGK